MNSGVILKLIEEYGLIAVFLSIMLEYACFPVPSEIVLPFAGAYASVCGVPFWKIFLVSIAAGLLGCLICYLIGYYGGTAILAWVSRRFPKSRGGIEASQKWFDRYGAVSVAFGRVLPLCRTYISFAAGLSRQRPLSFLGFSALGIAVWNLVLTGLGYKLAGHWETITLFVRRYTVILFPIVLLLIFFVFLSIRRRAKRDAK